MKILITGCDGQLGKELTKMLLINENHTLRITNKKTLDICNFNAVNNFITKNKFDVVINCASYTKVDLCEEDVELAFSVNSLGAKNLAIVCESIGAKIFYISTDYVFDGESIAPYHEYDIKDPKSIYGKSKALGESYTQTFSSKYFIIRTAWLYGDGNNFVKTMIDLSKTKSSIDVVNDQFGSPTSTKDLATCIVNLMDTTLYGTYHGTCEGTCSWYEFACKIFKLKGIEMDVNPVTSFEYNTVAYRPKFSVLDNFLLRLNNLDTFRHWEEALEDYLSS